MNSCHCGEIILADTENWDEPLCHKHYCEFLGNYQSQLNEANEILFKIKNGVSLSELSLFREYIEKYLKEFPKDNK